MDSLSPELYQVVYEYCYLVTGRKPSFVYVYTIMREVTDGLIVSTKTTPDELKEYFRKWAKTSHGREKHKEHLRLGLLK